MKLTLEHLISHETNSHYVLVKRNDSRAIMAISATTIGNSKKETDGLYLYHYDRNDRTCDRDKNGCLIVIGVDII